ncbi:DUF7824 domain-containing protein [Actinoplanes aureus]|uniref:DUF7824 domain-containing protein n=1 Tax=Actinoplanes aureus TaxID=2792083 RepID=A0A931C7S6_9ACTN|nr:DUF6493 family protein [Actinoplanes aureus]MBG0562952.1 hypothetical protein [Actinoplanes aureus]
MSLTWAGLAEPLRRTDSAGLTRLLLDATAEERLAFAAQVEARVRADADAFGSAGCLALAVVACMPTAARAAALLTRRGMREWHLIRPGCFLEIARARRLTWIGELGVRLARRLPERDTWPDDWRFVEALLIEGDAEPPVTGAVVRAWLRSVQDGAVSFRGSPWLDLLLPAVFEIDGVGGELPGASFPSAIAALVAEGRLVRKTVLDATVDRLARPDRPVFLRPFARLHDELAPTALEMTAFVADYARLLPDAPSPIAGLAQRALRAVDDAGLLGVEKLVELSSAVLLRSEKTLVKAQLSWLDRVVRREPERAAEILAVVAVAFGHPAMDVQERALGLIGVHLRRLAPQDAAGLAVAAGELPGVLRDRAAGLFAASASRGALTASGHGVGSAGPQDGPGLRSAGTRPGRPEPQSARTQPGGSEPQGDGAEAEPRPGPWMWVAEMPPPIGTAAELAEELTALAVEKSAVGWERAMAGLVTLHAAGDPDGLSKVLGPVLERCGYDDAWDDIRLLGMAVNAAIGRHRNDGGRSLEPFNVPPDVLTARLAELATWLTGSPVPVLLATPTHVSGSLDAGVLTDRLARLEDEGRDPWPFDFEQALLRVARTDDVAVLARAAALTSPEGKRLAEWLGEGGRPDPTATRFVQLADDDPHDTWSVFDSGPRVHRRVVADLAPPRAGGSLPLLGKSVFTIDRRPTPREDYEAFHYYRPDVLAMVLPQDREAVAAWALPEIAALADQDSREETALPLLADCAGPAGPATTLALAYGLGARHPAGRAAAVDTFLAVTSGSGSLAAAIGTELGDLCGDGTVKLNRVAAALADVHAAGASAAVWQLLRTALPLLLPVAPRGLPDLLELATRVADALGRRGDEIGGLAEVAGRVGGSRLVREAKRLHSTLALG